MEEFGAINLQDYRFNFGVGLRLNDVFAPLPEEFGRFVLRLNYDRDANEDYKIEMANCTDLFPYANHEWPARVDKALTYSYCVDATESFIKGQKIFGDAQEALLELERCLPSPYN